LDAAALAGLPAELKNGLEQALVRIDSQSINRIIDEIRPRAPSVAKALVAAAGNLQFDKILKLIGCSQTGCFAPGYNRND
jgi:hypothetical protein